MKDKCNHSDKKLVKVEEFSANENTYVLKVFCCNKCGKYLYGYNGLVNEEWHSLNDVKIYLLNL